MLAVTSHRHSIANDVLAGRDKLLTPGFVAELMSVDAKTVSRWAAAGRLTAVRTAGGHRRFLESEVRALLSAYSEDFEGGDEL